MNTDGNGDRIYEIVYRDQAVELFEEWMAGSSTPALSMTIEDVIRLLSCCGCACDESMSGDDQNGAALCMHCEALECYGFIRNDDGSWDPPEEVP